MRFQKLALGVLFAVALYGQTQNQPAAVRSHAEEIAEWWNHVGNKLIAMAKDFPEDKYDFKVQDDERSFAENLLHVAAVDFDVAGKVAGKESGPDAFKGTHNPPRAAFPGKAEIVKVLEQAVAAGTAVIRQQGDTGLDRTMPFNWETGRHTVHVSYAWVSAIEHSAEHLGQLVVYYRASHLVPPESLR